jgi:arylsulfatase
VRPPGIVAAILVAGALTGAADTLLTLAASPDPGLLTYKLAYVFGPILFALVWAAPVGAIVAELCRRRGRGARGVATAAAGTIQGVWAASLLVDGWRAGQGPFALIVLTGALGVATVAFARLAVDTAACLAARTRTTRAALSTTAAALLFGGVLAATPRGTSGFRGGDGPCAEWRMTAAERSVLLITVDALRADAARSMRSYRRLAAEGVEFTQHVTTSPWTLPSLASLLTGLPPAAHGAGESLSSRSLVLRSPLRRDVPALAGLLGAHGLRTHAVVTNPYLTPRYGVDRGFCTFENVSMEGEAVRALGQTTQLRLARALAARWLPSDRAPVVRRRAERWLAEHADRPFLLWLHFLDPHAPYGDRDGSPTSLVLDLMAFQRDGATGTPFRGVGLARAGEYRPGPEERRRIRALYQDDVDTVDRELGALLDWLDARGIRRRTTVVLTADHGEEFWEHGGLEHGRSLHEEVLRVPLVVAVPGATPETHDGLSTVLDVAPTVLLWVGADASGLPGADLLDPEAVPTHELPLGQTLFGEQWSGFRTASWKYACSESGEERLYDLVGDPEERRNLAAWGALSSCPASRDHPAPWRPISSQTSK